jgi:hypothetical protein
LNAGPTRARSAWRGARFFAVPCLYALVLTVFFLSPLEGVLATGMAEDDAFYYLNIAANVTAGHGSTFDGLSRTNGYHPLWLVLLLPVYAALGSNPPLAFRAACLLGVILLLLSALLWNRHLFKSFTRPWTATLGIAIFCFLSFFSSSHAMEMPLLMLVTAAYLTFFALRDPLSLEASARDELLAGTLLALAFLARLDMVFLGFATVLGALLKGWRRHAPPRRIVVKVLRLLAPCLVLSAPYLAWNLIRFRHLVPISGTLKSSFPHVGPHPYVLTHLGIPVVFSLGVGVVLLLGGLLRASRDDPLVSGLKVLSVMALLQVVYAFLFEKWGFAHWQMAPTFFLGSFGAAWVFEAIMRLAESRVGARACGALGALAVVGAVVVTLAGGVRFRLLVPESDSFYVAEYVAANWAHDRLPADAVLAAKSDAGLFGYFSRRRVININDGLVNNFEYQKTLKEKGLAAYLKEMNVGWLLLSVDPVNVRDGVFGLMARGYLYNVESEEIPVSLADAVYQSPRVSSGWGSGKMFLAIVPFGEPPARESRNGLGASHRLVTRPP